jgi:hypothetical protein
MHQLSFDFSTPILYHWSVENFHLSLTVRKLYSSKVADTPIGWFISFRIFFGEFHLQTYFLRRVFRAKTLTFTHSQLRYIGYLLR